MAAIDEAVERLDQLDDVERMETGSRLIEQEDNRVGSAGAIERRQ